MSETRIERIVLRSLGVHRLRSALALLAIVASIVLVVVPPLVLARAVDGLTQGRVVSFGLSAAYFALIAGSAIASALREALITATGESIAHALRTAMMAKLRRLPAPYFTGRESGEIASFQVNDVDAIEKMFSSGVISMFTDLGTVVATLAVVFTKSAGLGILLCATLPLLFGYTVHVQRRSLAAHVENRKATAEASGIIPETLRVIRSLHVYQAEGFAQKRYEDAVGRSFGAIEKTNFYDSVYAPVIITASAVVIGAMMSLSGQGGAFQQLFGMSVGTAVALISYVNSIFTPLNSIGMEIQSVQSAAAGWKRVQSFLDEDERLVVGLEHEDGAAPEDERAHAAIEVRDLSFSYDGEHSVLQHVSLEVEEGEFVTLAGRTGVGKSTLFKLLLGLYEPDEGRVLVAGRRPSRLEGADRRKTVCCVEQRLVAVPGTLRDQVTLGNTAFDDAAVWRALETVGLAGAVEALPARLDEPYRDALFSQGEKQLLTIARGIVSDPEVVLLDEIAAGLDSTTENLVLDALRRASEDRTVLSISHRIPREFAGRVVNLSPSMVKRDSPFIT